LFGASTLGNRTCFALPFIQPCKPKLATKVPVGPLWQFEIKQDGYRVQCHVLDGQVRIYTKNGHDRTERFPGIVGSMQELSIRSAVIDGEAMIEGEGFVSDFWALHEAAMRRHAPDAFLYAFDLLHIDGEDLRPLPLAERQFRLERLLIPGPGGIDLAPHPDGDHGEAMLEHVCSLGLEGIVAKRRDAPYRSGYQDTWLKLKCTKTESFAVIGYEAVRGGVRSLRVAHLVDGALVPAGSVGSGLAHETARALWVALEAGKPVVIDVEFRGWTPAGELRHAVFKGGTVAERDNAIRGVTLSGRGFTAIVGTEVGGTYTSILVSVEGEDEADGLELDYAECLKLHERLGKALDEVRRRLG
jgi:bifunctional non-homologous end joining protein LigD